MSASRHILQDTIEDVLMPSAISPSQAESPRPFNISLGLPLSGYPVVHTALALLRVVTNAHHTPQTALQQLLLSPYWSQADSEGDARALLDAALRKRLGTHVTLSRYLQTVQQQMAAGNSAHLQAPVLLQHLQSLADAASILDTFNLPSEWAREMQAAIDAGKLAANEPVTAEALVKAGVLRRAKAGVRLLGSGEIKAKVAFEVHGASKSAVAAVEKAGGSVKLLAPPKTSETAT